MQWRIHSYRSVELRFLVAIAVMFSSSASSLKFLGSVGRRQMTAFGVPLERHCVVSRSNYGRTDRSVTRTYITNRQCFLFRDGGTINCFRKKKSSLFATLATDDTSLEEEYDWDTLLPFEDNNYNSIKIIVPNETKREGNNMPDEKELDPFDAGTFHSKLEATAAAAERLRKTAIWITIPITRARLIEEASKSGFEFHHAEGKKATLSKWILEEESRIPTYATHQVGVGAVVINPTTNEILCVREKRRNYRPWKIPGGLAELGEDIDAAVIREVFEETGIRCRFLSILGVRHMHGAQFGRSDLFFVCRLEPVPDAEDGSLSEPVPQEGEIEAVKWLPLEEYRAMVNNPEKGRGHPMMSNILKLVDQDWKKNDIQRMIVPSVVPGRKQSPLYHAPIRTSPSS